MVIVPLYWGYFSIVRVKCSPKPVTELPASALEGLNVILKNDSDMKGIYRDGNEVDLGFYVEIEPIKLDIPRSYANSALQSRMKIRQTNADINDLESEILAVSKRKEPVNLHDVIADEAAKIILSAITDNANPIDTEKLVRWYMKKAGAANVYKPSKPAGNPNEDNYADADVAAEFSREAISLAQENSVRLINGMEFAHMLVDAGISDINDFTSM